MGAKARMEYPSIGSTWVHKTLKNDNYIITIIEPTKHFINYTYHKDGHIGGCNSLEWFYSEWNFAN